MKEVRERPSIPSARYAQRLERAREVLSEAGGRALLVGVGADLRWLTGYQALPLERLTMLVVSLDAPPTLVVPRLERAAAEAAAAVRNAAVELLSWEETEDPIATVVAHLTRSDEGGDLLVSDRLWATFLLAFQRALPEASFGLASRVLAPLREVKDAEEVELLREAAHAADRVVEAMAAGRVIGRSEADIAQEVRERLVAEGHDAAAFWIVASGPNSASPHHDAGERVVEAGEPIVLDIGGTIEGYGSDVTRTVWVTGGDPSRGPDGGFRQLYGALHAAQAAATNAIGPGVTCEAVDRVARAIIGDAGYGSAFIHRTGHGIGLEGHEDPYLVEGNVQPLREGHAFSVEPGIYLEGRYGARIEDIVVCGPAGADVLNMATRELMVVDGR